MKKHIYACEKIITFVLAFALIIGLWSSIGVDAKAAGEATIYRDGHLIQQGDIINTGDTVVINVPNGINSIYIICYEREIGHEHGAHDDFKPTAGAAYTFPEFHSTSGKVFSKFQFKGSSVDRRDSTILYVGVDLIDDSTEIVPGGNISGGNTSNGNTSNGNTAGGNKADDNVTKHICSFEWVITLDPTTGADGLEEYKCTGCGVVQESHPIPASVAVVKDFYGKVKEAPEKGSITYDSGKLYTISDYILKKMAERNDVAVTVKFEYQNKKYQIIFPAGLDYSAVLNDEESMYGYFGAAAKLGLKVTGQ